MFSFLLTPQRVTSNAPSIVYRPYDVLSIVCRPSTTRTRYTNYLSYEYHLRSTLPNSLLLNELTQKKIYHIFRRANRITGKYPGLYRELGGRMKNDFKVGDHVQSHYRARWYGIITQVTKRNGMGSLIEVLVTHDKCGRPQRKPFLTQLDASWLEEVC